MNKKQFTEMAKHVLHPKRKVRSPQLMHPTRDWWIGLCIAIAFFSVSSAWSAVTYLQYREIAHTGEEADEIDIVVYRESLVNASLAEFEARAERYNALLAGAITETMLERERIIEIEESPATTTEPVSESESATTTIDVSGSGTPTTTPLQSEEIAS